MTDDELKAIETHLNTRVTDCDDPERTTDHESAQTALTLLAELRRLKENPDCPACGHSVTEHGLYGDAGAVYCPACPCEDWRMP